MEAIGSSETSVETQRTTRRHIPEDDTIHNLHCESLKSYMHNDFSFPPECLRKAARGEVTVRSPGTGLITINNKSIEYFEHMQDREQVGCTTLSLSYIEDQ
jgi:hypothetical protein